MRAGFVISEVFQNLRRNTFMIISVVLVTFISLVFVGASMIVQFQVSKAKGDWYNKVHVVVYLCPEYEFSFTCPTGEGATDVDLKRVQGIIKSELSKEVKEVAVQTKAEAYEQFLAKYPGGVYKTQTMTEDDMQISLRLKLNNPNDFQMVNDVLSGREGVQAVYDERQLFENIFNVLNKLTFIGIALAVLMLFSAVLLIATTIRLSAASRKQESEIMRLVGASSMFIQLPFLLEGALAATLGAVFACIFIGVVINMFFPHLLYSSAKWIDLVNLSDVSIVFPVLIIIAIVISIISSAITLRKYTKV